MYCQISQYMADRTPVPANKAIDLRDSVQAVQNPGGSNRNSHPRPFVCQMAVETPFRQKKWRLQGDFCSHRPAAFFCSVHAARAKQRFPNALQITLAREAEIPRKRAESYLGILEDLLLGFRLQVFQRRTQHLRALCQLRADSTTLSFWRTRSGLDVDFVVYGPNLFQAIDVKRAGRVTATDRSRC